MHWLSDKNRDEFLAIPQLVRLERAEGKDGLEPTLLIKGNTLLLKYIVLGVRLQLAFALCNGSLLYALRVLDDENEGGILWSIAERQEEIEAVRALVQGQSMMAFLFNEVAVNVAQRDFLTLSAIEGLESLVKNATLASVDYQGTRDIPADLLDKFGDIDSGWITIEIDVSKNWSPLKNHFVTAAASSSLIDLFDTDEGNQQEQIGVWLTDNLHPSGAYHSPQRPHKSNETRELIDILLNYEFGVVLVESKTLSILTRANLPNRSKLQRGIEDHIAKAFKQLRGAIRKLKNGEEITSSGGEVLSIQRDIPSHAIVLVPDLNVIEDPQKYGPEFIQGFMDETGGFAHLLDISELLRVVQAAEMLSARSTTMTPMMAFDSYLIDRAREAAKAGTLCIEVLLRFPDEQVGK